MPKRYHSAMPDSVNESVDNAYCLYFDSAKIALGLYGKSVLELTHAEARQLITNLVSALDSNRPKPSGPTWILPFADGRQPPIPAECNQST